jgi:hypothetical protein
MAGEFVHFWTNGKLMLPFGMTLSIAAMALSSWLLVTGQALLTGINRQRQAAMGELVSGVLCLILTTWGVRHGGVGAVGLGLVSAALLTSGWILPRELKRHLHVVDLYPDARYFLRVVGATCLTGVIIWLAVQPEIRPTLGAWFRLAGGGLIGLVLYLAFTKWLNVCPLQSWRDLRRSIFRPSL